jgi:hypothetical protein
MKARPLAAITPLRMPRKPHIISILLLVGFGFMLVGGASPAWAAYAEVRGKIVRVAVNSHPDFPNGRVFIEVSPLPPQPLGTCPHTKFLEFDTNDESYKAFLSAAFVAYTSGKKVVMDVDDVLCRPGDGRGARVYGLVLEPD